MMNDDVLGMYAFLLFSPMIMLNLLKRNVVGASRYILIPFILGILSEKNMQIPNAILAGVALQRLYFFFSSVICFVTPPVQ